jgi:hypothetical protein
VLSLALSTCVFYIGDHLRLKVYKTMLGNVLSAARLLVHYMRRLQYIGK